MNIQAPKGTKDILPNEIYKWHYVEKIINDICMSYNYKEIRMPVFESTELYKRGVGDTTDIVQKEMYTFNDKKGRSLTLRPEGTAGVVRSFIENGMSSYVQPVKLYYNITAYRYEKAQKGRYREFNQFGVEIFGAKSSAVDAEIVSMMVLLFEKLNINNIELKINSIGCSECRKVYNDKLKMYLESKLDKLCETCNTRYIKNPLRILDCKEDKCKNNTSNAPDIIDNLCDECSDHFNEFKHNLELLEIDFSIDNRIVRGLDYYTKTVFEFVSNDIGSQGTVCAGGRYDGLIKECGGVSTPGIGLAMGIERLILTMESQKIEFENNNTIDLYIASLGYEAGKFVRDFAYKLRKNNIEVETDLMERSLKKQMKYADKINARYSIVIGEDEIKNKVTVLKNMKTGEKKEIKIESINKLVEVFENE